MDVLLRQQQFSKAIDQAVFYELLATAPNTRSKALTLSSSITHAGDWLSVIPSSALGLHLHDWEFRLCLQYWPGLRMVEEGTRCPVCQVVADPFGDYQVGCGKNGDRIDRHNSLRDALYSAAQFAALAPRRDVPSLIPRSRSRPADIYLPNCMEEGPASSLRCYDYFNHAANHHRGTTTQGHALSVGEERKMVAHDEACQSVGVSFNPRVVETIGGWSDRAADTIRCFGRLLGQRLGIPSYDSTTHLFQRLSICLWKGNSTMWIRSTPIRPAEVDGVV